MFKNPTACPPPSDPAAIPEHPVGSNVFVVVQSRSTCDVTWQDGSVSTLPTTELEHCLDMDEVSSGRAW